MSEVKESSPAEIERERWEEETLKPALNKHPERKKNFQSVSLDEVERLYTPADIADLDFARDTSFPGEFPYTRGIHPTGYRGKLWTMRQFAGFGTAADTNQRFKYLLSQGQTGLSVAFHLPTLYGYDSDHHYSPGEVGKCGVALDSVADMETLFGGINLEDVTVSMTINSPAPIALAMYLAVAEKQGADWKKISGTLQNDILKEYIAQKEYIYPPRPSMRLITDIFKFCATEVPKYNTISISGYHIREAGSTALQGLAFTLRDGMEYVEYGTRAGLSVDPFGGSYFMEELTNKMEQGCFDYIEKIDQFGGMVEAIEAGFPQREIWDASYQFQRAVDSAEKVVAGVNAFQMDTEDPYEILYIDESATTQQQLESLKRIRATRDNQKV